MKCKMTLPIPRSCPNLHAKLAHALAFSATLPTRSPCCCRHLSTSSKSPTAAGSDGSTDVPPSTSDMRSRKPSKLFTRSNALYFDQIKSSPFHHGGPAPAAAASLKRDPIIPGRHLDGEQLHPDELEALRSLERKFVEYQERDEPDLLLRDARAYVDFGITPFFEESQLSNRHSSRTPTRHLLPKPPEDPAGRKDRSPIRPASLALYHSVLWALSKSASPDHALCVLEEMPRMGIPRDSTAWTHYIAACAANRDPERIRQALLAAEHVDGIKPTGEMYEAAVIGYVQCAEFDRAMAIVCKMRRAHHGRVGGPAASAVKKDEAQNTHYLSWETLGLLLRRLVAARRTAEVAEVFRDVRVGLVQTQPVVWWAELVRVFAQANYTEFAKQAFTRLLQLVPTRSTTTSTLDEGTLTAMLDLAARSADPILAAHVLKVMTSFHMTPTENHFCALVLAFGRARDFKSVIYMLSLMRKAGFNAHIAAHSVLQPMLNMPLEAAAATSTSRPDVANPARATLSSSADQIDVPANLQRPITTVTQWRAAALLLPVLKGQARFAIDPSAMAMLINNARILQVDDQGLDLYRRRASLGVPLDRELAHAALSCCRGAASGDRERVLEDMQRAGVVFNDKTYVLLIRLTLGDLLANRTEALMQTTHSRKLDHLEGRLEQADGKFTDHDETYPARVTFANFDVSPWLDRAVGYLDRAKQQGCVSARQCVLLLRNLARFGDARWRDVAKEIVQRGYFVDTKTVDKVVERYPNDEVAKQLATLAAARARPRRSESGPDGGVARPAADSTAVQARGDSHAC